MGTIRRRKQYAQIIGKDKKIKRVSKERIVERCADFDVQYIKHYVGRISNTVGTRVVFTCGRHVEKGEIDMPWGKFSNSAKGCPYCAGKHKTTADFQKEVSESIILQSEYLGLEKLITCKCAICGHVWDTLAGNLKGGRACPKCRYVRMAAKRRITQADFQEKIKRVNANILVIGKYRGVHTTVKCKCSVHDVEWSAYPSNLLNRSSTCPQCAKESMREKSLLSNDEFINRLSSINSKSIPQEPYDGFWIPIKCICSDHGLAYYITPRDLFRRRTHCEKCMDRNLSSGEYRIATYLDQIGVEYFKQHIFDDCAYINNLRFDFYIPEYNLAIEYDGEQHYRPVFPINGDEEAMKKNYWACKMRDEIKTAYCHDNNIRLLRIPFWDKDCIELIIKRMICA